jgi:hypothetical protein
MLVRKRIAGSICSSCYTAWKLVSRYILTLWIDMSSDVAGKACAVGLYRCFD